jgi:hypothetical protein
MFVPDSKIGDVGAIALAEILKHNTTIELVALEGIDTTEKGAIALTNIWDGFGKRKKKIHIKIALGVRVVYLSDNEDNVKLKTKIDNQIIVTSNDICYNNYNCDGVKKNNRDS